MNTEMCSLTFLHANIFVVMLFGAEKIPEIAKGLGKMMREVKDASNEIRREIKDSTKDI